MTWNPLNPYGERVMPLNLSVRERAEPVSAQSLDAQLFDAQYLRESLNDRFDELYGDRSVDERRLHAPANELPPHMTTRRS